MSSSDTNHGKILLHGSDAGEITSAAIEARAREIALIDGRTSVTLADRREARREFQQETLPGTMSEDSATIARSANRDPSEPAAEPGHQIPDRNTIDDQDMIERLAIEGVEEAQHDQMLAARRNRSS